LTDEQKKAMRDGRVAAALARKNAEKPADLPAGHERDEARRMVADQQAEQIEINAEALGVEAIDESKLHRKDNEIQRHIVRKGPQQGNIPIQNPQPGWRYMRHSPIGAFEDNSAKAAVRQSLNTAKQWGWIFIGSAEDSNPVEDEDFKGCDCAAGSNLRGVGDVLTMKIREEDARAMDAYYRNIQDRQGYVEERLAMIGAAAGIPVWAGDVSKNPELAKRFGPEFSKPVSITSQFRADDLRPAGKGIPGYPPPGTR